MILDQATLERYRRKLRYKVAYHLGAASPDLEDVVQETMIRFLRALRTSKMRNPESTAAFLSGICNNVIHEYQRRVQKEAVNDSGLGTALDLPLDSGADLVELRQAISLAMMQLAPRERELLRAFFLEQRDKTDICNDLDLSDVQFRVILFRAKQKFREIYRLSVKQNAAGKH